jgi:hypothetical protein
LEEIETNFISDIPLDPMHLVDLGVMRRFLKYILFEGNVIARLSAASRRTLNANIEEVSPSLPTEFTRKVRSLNFFSRWKASECRQFLLYIGPVVLSDVLKSNVFKCFLLFHAAIFILSSEKLMSTFLDDADQFLKIFVSYSAQIFGEKFLSYNVHSLMHLVSDVSRHGPLQIFSAYPFESELGWIKSLVKSSNLPLQQIFKRLCEKRNFQRCKEESEMRGAFGEHSEGPLPDGINAAGQFHSYEGNKYILRDRYPDKCVLMRNRCYGLILNILSSHDGNSSAVKIVTREFTSFTDIYYYLIPSGKLGIHKLWNLSSELKIYDLKDIRYKAILLVQGGKHIVFPFLHSL